MNIKELMFLKAATGGEVKECAPIYFSAKSINPGGSPTSSGVYGTTLNTTSAADNEVVVTQVYNSDYQPGSYHNGYICIGFDKLMEWAAAGETLWVDADIDITENPASVSKLTVIISNKQIEADITGGEIHISLEGVGEYNKDYVEIRCGGCSFTLSNCKLSIE